MREQPTSDYKRPLGSRFEDPKAWVLLVAVGFALAQLLLLDVSRFLSWDEAVYVSQVSPFAEALSMGAHRARGTTFVVAPLVSLTDSMVALRIYLSVVSGAALFGSFALWCRIVGRAAPIAAGLFATGWFAVYYGSAVYPNLYSALVALAVIGLAARFALWGRRRDLYWVGSLLVAGTLVRPLDALVTAGCALILTAALQPKSAKRVGLACGFGLAVGAVPWSIEAVARFGGPIARLEEARAIVGGGLRNNLADYLQLLDGRSGAVDPGAMLWISMLIGLGVLGALMGSRRRRRLAAMSLISALLLVVPYIFATEPVELRFILPAFALLCVGSGLGLDELIRRVPLVYLAPLAVLAGFVLVWNLGVLNTWSDRQVRNGETALQLADAVRSRARGEPCYFLSSFNYPAISFGSGCSGAPLGDSVDDNQRRLDRAPEGATLLVVTNDPDPTRLVGADWDCDPIPAASDPPWEVCWDTS